MFGGWVGVGQEGGEVDYLYIYIYLLRMGFGPVEMEGVSCPTGMVKSSCWTPAEIVFAVDITDFIKVCVALLLDRQCE